MLSVLLSLIFLPCSYSSIMASRANPLAIDSSKHQLLFNQVSEYLLAPLHIRQVIMQEKRESLFHSERKFKSQYSKTLKGDLFSASIISTFPLNWQNLSYQDDNVVGSSLNKLHQIVPAMKSTTIIAVIDSGIDVNHPQLNSRIWINRDELPNNGIDDDNNGYIDDVMGWNFIGHPRGMAFFEQNNDSFRLISEYPELQIQYDSLALTREYLDLRESHKKTPIQFKRFKELEKKILQTRQEHQKAIDEYQWGLEQYNQSTKLLKQHGLSDFDYISVLDFDTTHLPYEVQDAQTLLLKLLEAGMKPDTIQKKIQFHYIKLNYHYNISYDPRFDQIQDRSDNFYAINYGNNDVKGPNSLHGTFVAGIIAALRDEKEIDGGSEQVQIMPLRVVPDGDERDKDVYYAIKYAVDNGAHIINLSFGKNYSPFSKKVLEIIKYAQSKGVAIVHAAGNENSNNDIVKVYPNGKDQNSQLLSNWIEVGASSSMKGVRLITKFSNYGKKSVHLFAPGDRIYSTALNNSYETLSGTSFAAPVVAAVLATLKNKLNAPMPKITQAVLQETNKFPNLTIFKPGTQQMKFSDFSISQGTVNAFKAYQALEGLR